MVGRSDAHHSRHSPYRGRMSARPSQAHRPGSVRCWKTRKCWCRSSAVAAKAATAATVETAAPAAGAEAGLREAATWAAAAAAKVLAPWVAAETWARAAERWAKVAASSVGAPMAGAAEQMEAGSGGVHRHSRRNRCRERTRCQPNPDRHPGTFRCWRSSRYSHRSSGGGSWAVTAAMVAGEGEGRLEEASSAEVATPGVAAATAMQVVAAGVVMVVGEMATGAASTAVALREAWAVAAEATAAGSGGARCSRRNQSRERTSCQPNPDHHLGTFRCWRSSRYSHRSSGGASLAGEAWTAAAEAATLATAAKAAAAVSWAAALWAAAAREVAA